jgi:hypothetical protein
MFDLISAWGKIVQFSSVIFRLRDALNRSAFGPNGSILNNSPSFSHSRQFPTFENRLSDGACAKQLSFKKEKDIAVIRKNNLNTELFILLKYLF